jgi:hypothetical protein
MLDRSAPLSVTRRRINPMRRLDVSGCELCLPAVLRFATMKLRELEMLLISRIQSHVWLLRILFLAAAGLAQNQPVPPRSRPVPQVAGRFIDTDGTRSLTMHYELKGRPKTFVGFIHSRCMLPAGSKSGGSEPLDLKAIPLGTPMTVYYVRRQVGKESQNIVLSMRFDRVPGGAALPGGVIFPCFKAAGQTTR